MQQFGLESGLSHRDVQCIHQDRQGFLWFWNKHGLYRFDGYQFKRFTTEKYGLQSNEINHIIEDHLKDFQTDSLELNSPLVVTSFQIFDGKENRMRDKTTEFAQTGEILLQPDDCFFRLEFSLLSYQNAVRNQYAYRIDGIDDYWNYQREQTLQFGRLPYGNHNLHIKEQDASGKWSEKELHIPITVRKPFYLKGWFLTIGGLTLMFGGLSFYKLNTGQLKWQKVQLEREVSNLTETIHFQKEQLEEQTVELRELDKLKSRFFANVSHELHTPLSLILGPIGSALKSGELSNRNLTFLKKAQQSGKDLLKIVGNILDLSKLEARKMELHLETTQLLPFIRQTVSAFESHAEQMGIRFTFEYDGREDLLLKIDRKKLKTILNNFLSNALKFTQQGGAVFLKINDLTHFIRLVVSDTGRGILPDDLPKIFNRFFQSSNLTEGQSEALVEGGTGIGLALCFELAALMGGKVWAESEFEQGSSFYFEFPKKEVLQAVEGEQWTLGEKEPKTAPSPVIPDVVGLSHTSLATTPESRILIVEDNYSLRAYLESILSPHYQIITGENGQAVLDILRNETDSKLEPPSSPLIPDLILFDSMMPFMDGFQLLEKLKVSDEWRHIPVIMLTARVDLKAKLRALRIWVDDYLLKPFEEEELNAHIVNLLTNYREQMTLSAATKSIGQETSIAKKPVIAQVDAEWIENVEKIFNKILSDSRFKMDWVASEIYLSQRQFNRRIKQLTGLTPSNYLREMRLQKAKDLLHLGKYATVKETGFAVGFLDTQYFSKLFQDRFGVPPSAYLR